MPLRAQQSWIAAADFYKDAGETGRRPPLLAAGRCDTAGVQSRTGRHRRTAAREGRPRRGGRRKWSVPSRPLRRACERDEIDHKLFQASARSLFPGERRRGHAWPGERRRFHRIARQIDHYQPSGTGTTVDLSQRPGETSRKEHDNSAAPVYRRPRETRPTKILPSRASCGWRAGSSGRTGCA